MPPRGPVAAVPNWADLQGEVERVEPADAPGFVKVLVAVRTSRNVPGFVNLFARAPGTSVEVLVPAHLAARVRSRCEVVLRVRRGAPRQVHVHPDHVYVVGSPSPP